MLAPICLLLVMSFGANKMSAGAVQGLYWAFTASMGLSLSTIFLVYTGQSILRIFFITAGMFAAMSLYGYTTKRDLTGMGRSEEHTSELQSLMRISYAVFCLKKKKKN